MVCMGTALGAVGPALRGACVVTTVGYGSGAAMGQAILPLCGHQLGKDLICSLWQGVSIKAKRTHRNRAVLFTLWALKVDCL